MWFDRCIVFFVLVSGFVLALVLRVRVIVRGRWMPSGFLEKPSYVWPGSGSANPDSDPVWDESRCGVCVIKIIPSMGRKESSHKQAYQGALRIPLLSGTCRHRLRHKLGGGKQPEGKSLPSTGPLFRFYTVCSMI